MFNLNELAQVEDILQRSPSLTPYEVQSGNVNYVTKVVVMLEIKARSSMPWLICHLLKLKMGKTVI